MLPPIFVHTLPLSLLLSLGEQEMWLRRNGSDVFFRMLRSAQKVWRRVAWTIIVLSTFLLIMCSGWIGPYFYTRAKRELVERSAQLVQSIPAKVYICLGNRLHLWYQKRVSRHEWHGLRIGLIEKSGSVTFFSAEQALLKKRGFVLCNGAISQRHHSRTITHEFGSMELPYDGYISTRAQHKVRTKHATISGLLQQSGMQARKEIVSRSLLWCLAGVAPFILLSALNVFLVSSMLGVVCWSGALFIGMHVLNSLTSFAL